MSLEITIIDLKMMVKRGVELFILKFSEPLQRYLLTCQANSTFLGRFFYTGQQQPWTSLQNFKIKSSTPLFTFIFMSKMSYWSTFKFWLNYRHCLSQKWYFVIKIALTYCEKKLFEWSRKTCEIWEWKLRIYKKFEITKTIYSNSKMSEQFW